ALLVGALDGRAREARAGCARAMERRAARPGSRDGRRLARTGSRRLGRGRIPRRRRVRSPRPYRHRPHPREPMNGAELRERMIHARFRTLRAGLRAFRTRWGAFGAASALALGAVALSPTAGFAVQAKLQIAPEFRRWTFERPRVEHRVDQSYVAADLEFQFDSGLDLAAGGNFVSTVHHEGDVTGNIDRLGELRIRGEQRLLSDRLRVRARAAFPLEEDGFLPREIRALRILEIPQLEFPLADAGISSHQEIELTGQVV